MVDADPDGQPTAAADGDDMLDGSDDEDGVAFTSALLKGRTASLTVSASASGLLNAWLDFNADGDWADDGEQIFTNEALAAGANPLTFSVPDNAAVGRTFARFRFSTAGGLSYRGFAPDGEVEDYQVAIYAPAIIRFTTAASSADESAGTVDVGLTLDIPGGGGLISDVTVDVDDLLSGSATPGAGNDYSFTDPTTVTFPAGSPAGTTRNVSLTIRDDAVLEPDETVDLQLTNLVDPWGQTSLGTPLQHRLTIVNNDTAAVTIADVTAVEGVGHVFTVVLDNAVQGQFTVTLSFTDVTATGGGVDYDSTAQVVTFAGTVGETHTVTVPTTEDAFVEGPETFRVSLSASNPQVDDSDTAIGTLTDNDVILDDGDPGYSENGSGWVRVWDTFLAGYAVDWTYHAASSGGTNVAQWAVTGITPGRFEVYVTWVPFNNRATNAPFAVYDGTTQEAVFRLNQQNVPTGDVWYGGRPFQRLGTVFNISATSLSVRLTDGADNYVIADAVVLARVGNLPPTLTVELPVDQVSEAAGTLTATLSRAPGTSGNLEVSLSSSDTSEATVPVTVTIPDGQASTTFTVTLVDDSVADGTQTVTITATAGGFVTGTDTVLVLDNDRLTIDDGDARYSDSGAGWFRISSAQYPGYAGATDPSYGDWRYHAAGTGSGQATWSATGLTPGQYEVLVTWAPFSNRASNAPYSVYDGPASGGALEGTFRLSQQMAPRADILTGGRPFQRLGTFAIASTTLSVRLTDDANAYVIADAVQFARVGELPPTLLVVIVPEQVSEGDGTVTGTVTRTPGTAGELVVSLTSSDTTEATVPPTVTIPDGQGSAPFTVTIVDDDVADRTQTVSITATAAGFLSGSDTMQVTDNEIVTIDDGDPTGFSVSGTTPWVPVSQASYPGYAGVGDPSYGDWRYHAAGTGNGVATWSATGLTPGQYEVLVTWVPFNNRATNAPYKVYDGPVSPANLENTFVINQQNAPLPDVTFGGRPFQRLGVFNIAATTLSVTLSDNANNYVIADAVQFARLGDLPLRAAGGVAGDVGGVTAEPLTAAQAQPLLAEAAARWQAAGFDAVSVASVELVVGDLPGDLLGLASSSTNTIWLDADAAGHGWFVDATPWDDDEFDEEPAMAVADRMDALSVIFHELGHLQGLADLDALLHPDDPMADVLAAGVRRTSAHADASADHDAALAELLDE
jgi:hypothetical protein